MSHFIYWSKICHILLLVENMSHFITGRKYVPFYFWSKICPLLYWSKKCPSKKCPSKKRPSKKRPGAIFSGCTGDDVVLGIRTLCCIRVPRRPIFVEKKTNSFDKTFTQKNNKNYNFKFDQT